MAADVLPILALVWFIIVWSICVLGWHMAWEQPGVTILRPLCGLDDNLYENLESSFLQSYPTFELVFCMADERDQALPIVRALMERYTEVNARVVIGESQVGANPKVNNLARAYREASYDIVWIIDSNVITNHLALARAVDALQQPGVGLVHHVPFAMYPGLELGGRLDQAFLNTTHAKMYLAINSLHVDSCVVGKSNLFRRSDLARSAPLYKRLVKAGVASRPGLEPFAPYLGEDNVIGMAIWHGGKLKHAMTADVAGNTLGTVALQTYFWRRVRWIRVRKYEIAATLAEPLTESICCGLIGSYALKQLFGISPWLTFAAHEIAWCSLDTSIFGALLRASPAATLPKAAHELPKGLAFLFPWVLRELLAFPIWLTAMSGSTVSWRGRGKQYRVHLNGTVSVEEVAVSEAPLNGR